MPIAGPISIIITSNALKGKKRFCVRTALGASIVEFFYVLIAVYGITILFSSYTTIIPYLLLVGSFFLLFVGIKVFTNKLELDNIKESGEEIDKNIEKDKGGLRAGLIINLTNPSLFFGVLTSSFIVLSFASSIGLNTGGLEILMHDNVSSIQEITGEAFEGIDSTLAVANVDSNSSSYSLLLSVIYALSLASGGFLWLYILTRLLIKYRSKIKLKLLNLIIKSLGIFLFGISFYLMWESISIIFG
jgi:arginine exporter protein ArgO